MFSQTKQLGILAATGALVVAVGCTGAAGHDSGPSFGTEQPGVGQTSPVRIAVMLDQSGSRRWTRTPELDLQDLTILTQLLRHRGGEIGFGLIRDRSNRGLVRLRIEPPPTAPQPPVEHGNLFEAAERRALYEEKVHEYEKEAGRWASVASRRIEFFLAEIEPLIDSDKDANRTDVWGAVQRTELFLQEDDAGWKATTNKWAVFVSDGADNVGSKPLSLSQAVRTVVVNGSAELGSFESLSPARFESARAAFEFIAATEEGN